MSFMTDDIHEFVDTLPLGVCIDMLKNILMRAENAETLDMEDIHRNLESYDDEDIRETLISSIESSVMATLFRNFKEWVAQEALELSEDYTMMIAEFAQRLPGAWEVTKEHFLRVELFQ